VLNPRTGVFVRWFILLPTVFFLGRRRGLRARNRQIRSQVTAVVDDACVEGRGDSGGSVRVIVVEDRGQLVELTPR